MSEHLLATLYSVYAWLREHKEGITALGSVVAMLSATSAIVFALVSERRTRKHFSLSHEPLVHVRVGHSPEHHDLRIINDGLGLAILTEVKCFIDGKELGHKSGTRNLSFIEMFSFHERVSWDVCTIFTPREYYIRPGEHIPCLTLTLERLTAKLGKREAQDIMGKWVAEATRMSVKITYTSVLRNRSSIYESDFSATLLHGSPPTPEWLKVSQGVQTSSKQNST